MDPDSRAPTLVATLLAMIAFAANSVLCRLALAVPDIDPAGFTTIRLASGAVMLLAIARLTGRARTPGAAGNWVSGAALFGYAAFFSFAYVRLGVGAGALILFGTVQITIILWGVLRGERPGALQWLGLAVAMGGLAYLVSPGLRAPSPLGSLMMAGAGVSWGVYTIRGKGTTDPVVTTTDNFVRSVPMTLALAVLFHRDLSFGGRGVGLAIASGALASALGYVLWYAALRGLTSVRAASVQLTVPVLVAVGGVLFLAEPITPRVAVSAALILGGVWATFARPARRSARG